MGWELRGLLSLILERFAHAISVALCRRFDLAAPVPEERLSQVVPSEGAPLDSDESSGIERTMTMSV